ncbi:MAG: single-stranded DNA-binding protein [Eubacteriales bacterium]
MNRCLLIGNLTKDPELRSTPNGVSVCTFSIGVSRRFTGQNGERETDFFNIVVWRKQGENAAKYLRKGSQVAIAGQIQNRSYEAKDGGKRYITEIIAEEVQFLRTPNSDGGNSYEPPSSSNDGSQMLEINEDMPF